MTSFGPKTDTERRVLELLDDNPRRIEDIASELGMDYGDAKAVIHDLLDRSLVVSGPQFTFEADCDYPPAPYEEDVHAA